MPLKSTAAASTHITTTIGDAAGVSAQARHVAATLEWTAVPGLQAAGLHHQHPGAEVAHTLAGRRAGEASGSETHLMSVTAGASVQRLSHRPAAQLQSAIWDAFRRFPEQCYPELATWTLPVPASMAQ